tara:strand:+ start:895 stop:1161 length:267 start_codon:yes stop_codon:yes gene_type:complete
METQHNGEVGFRAELSEITAQQLHKLKKLLRAGTMNEALTVMIRETYLRAEDEEKKREKERKKRHMEGRPLVSVGQGEYRRDLMEGDV